MEVDAEGRDGRIVFTLLYVPERHLVHSDENASPKISILFIRIGCLLLFLLDSVTPKVFQCSKFKPDFSST